MKLTIVYHFYHSDSIGVNVFSQDGIDSMFLSELGWNILTTLFQKPHQAILYTNRDPVDKVAQLIVKGHRIVAFEKYVVKGVGVPESMPPTITFPK